MLNEAKKKLMVFVILFLGLFSSSLMANEDAIAEDLKRKVSEKKATSVKDVREVVVEKVKEKKGVRERRQLGVSAQAGGGSVGGISIDCFVTQYFNMEISFIAGFFPIAAGAKVYFTPQYNISPYIGVHGSYVGAVYTPVGVEYIHDNGFSIAIEGGALFLYDNGKDFYIFDFSKGEKGHQDDKSKGWDIMPWGGVKIGYHF